MIDFENLLIPEDKLKDLYPGEINMAGHTFPEFWLRDAQQKVRLEIPLAPRDQQVLDVCISFAFNNAKRGDMAKCS